MFFEEYIWVVVVGGFMAFFAAMGIGANDVANAFATSIGSGALTIKSAVIIAVICECAGAILMGSHVTDTIRKGIADYECFETNPPLLMMGCLCVLFSVGLWLFLASKLEMPVSTTHSCVGGMIGMTIAIGGGSCVNWYEPKDSFPFVGGVSGIVLSWFISPIFSAIVSMVIYGITRAAVLRRENSFEKSFWTFPIFVGLTVTLNTFFIIYKGAKGLGLHKTELWVSLVIAFGSGLFAALVLIPLLPVIKKCILKGIETRKRNKEIELSNKKTEDIEYNKVSKSEIENMKNSNSKSDLVSMEMDAETEDSENSAASKNAERRRRIKNKCVKCLDKSINYKVEYDMNKGDRVQ